MEKTWEPLESCSWKHLKSRVLVLLKSASQCSVLWGPNTKRVYFLDKKVTWEGPNLKKKNITGNVLLDGSEK